MKIVLTGIVVLIICAVIYYIAIPLYVGNKKSTSKDPTLWESDIEKFRVDDRTNPVAPDPIILVGSSSIRLWDGMPDKIAGFPVLNRGFGGAKIADLDYFLDELLIKHAPKMAVIYVGAIDLYINPDSAQQAIIDEYRALCNKIREKLPDTIMALIALRPSPYRATKYAAYNQALADIAANDEKIYFIDANKSVADENGVPRKDLYLWDRQHLNKEGYDLWGNQLLKSLNEIFDEGAGAPAD